MTLDSNPALKFALGRAFGAPLSCTLDTCSNPRSNDFARYGKLGLIKHLPQWRPA